MPIIMPIGAQAFARLNLALMCGMGQGAPRDHNAFGKMSAEQKIDALTEGKLIDAYLGQRLKEARQARNHLMHRAAVVSVRDLWSLYSIISSNS